MGTVFSALVGLIKRIIVGILTGIINNPGASSVFISSGLAGIAASNTWIGDLLGAIISWSILPDETPVVLFVLLLIAIVLDLLREGVPEAFAIFSVFVLPNAALAIPEEAKLHQKLGAWIDSLNAWLDKTVGEWLAPGAQEFTATCISFIGLGVAFMWVFRWGKGRYGTSGAPKTTTAGTTTTTTTSPVQRRRAAK